MRRLGALIVLTIGLLPFGAACGPAAGPTVTATTQAQPTATVAAARPSATVAQVQTTPKAEEAKVRPVPVLAGPPPNPLAQRGGIYRLFASADPPDFGIWDSSIGGPQGTFAHAVPVTDALLDTNEYESDMREQLLPNLAYDWWTNEAGTKWTFKIRENVKFSDGVQLTCADVKFMLDTIRLGRDGKGTELRRSPRGTLVRRISETRCPDANTFEVFTAEPLPSLLKTLAHASFAILPKHIYEGHLDIWLTTIGPGLGPFTFESYRQTEGTKLKKNPNYWNQPYPYLDGYHIINVGSTTAAQAAFRVGRSEEGTVPRSVRSQLVTEGKIFIQGGFANDGMRFYQPNWRRQPWKDPRFALALRCAIDSAGIIATASNSEGFEGPFFPLTETPGGNEWAISKEEWKASGPCHGPSGDAANMDKRRQMAKDLLAQMGFNAENPARPSHYTSPDDAITVAILSDWAKVNILPEMRVVTTSVKYDIQVSGESDIFQQGTIDSRRDPDHWLYAYFYSTSDRNYGKYGNPEVDTLIDLQSKTLDKAKRYKIVQQIEKILLRDNAMVVAQHSYFARQLSTWVKDSYWGPPTNNQNSGARYARVWIDQAKMKQVLGQ